jgi:hypothetical protein
MSTKLRTKDAESDWLAPKLPAFPFIKSPLRLNWPGNQHTPLLTVRTIAVHYPVLMTELRRILTAGLSIYLTIYLSIYLWLYRPLLGLGRFLSFLIYTQAVGLLGWGISLSQGRYLHIEQHKHRINAHRRPCQD